MRDFPRNRSMRLPRSSPYRSIRLLVALIVAALLLILLDRSGRLGPLRSQAQSILAPMLGVASSFGDKLGQFGSSVISPSAQQQISDLEQQVRALQQDRIENEALRQENAQLRRQVGIEARRPWKLLGVDIVARTPDSGRYTVLISVGANKNIKPGMAVIGQEGSSPETLIGVVEEVGPQSATVLLITDYNSTVSAKVYHNGTSFDGVLRGQWQRGSRLQMEQISRSVPIAPGDTVVTAGLTAEYNLDLPLAAIPSDIPIGSIETVANEDRSKSANVRPFLDPDQVQHAWVVLGLDE